MTFQAFQLWMEQYGEIYILCLAGLCFVPMLLGGDE